MFTDVDIVWMSENFARLLGLEDEFSRGVSVSPSTRFWITNWHHKKIRKEA